MGYYLFDNPKVGIIVAIVVEVVVFFLWLLARDKVRWYCLLSGPILAGVLLLLDWMVMTNREELIKTTEMVVQAAEDEQAQWIINALSDDFVMSNGVDKAQITAAIERYMSGPFIDSNFIAELLVVKDADELGQVEFAVRTLFDPKSRYAYTSYLRTRWRFDFARLDGDGPYQITNIVHLKIGGQTPTRDVFKNPY